MKQKRINFKLFGWRIFFDFDREDEIQSKRKRRSRLCQQIKELRNRRYRKTNGCCEMCGQHFDKDKMQMHHVMPFSLFPQWSRKSWNLMLLCPRCHWQMHFNALINSEAMQRTATSHGFNLRRELQRATDRRWERNVELRKGGAQ